MLHYTTSFCSEDKDWVVFVHGMGGNSNIWYKQIDEFRKHFNLMFIDLCGHGGSTKSIKKYSFEQLAGEIVETLDQAGIESAHFVGISLGSIVLDAFSLIAPGRIKSMVLGGAVMGYDLKSRFLLRAGAMIKWIIPYMWLYRLFAFIMMPRKNHAKSRQVFIREAKKLGGREFRKWYRLMETLIAFYKSFQTRPSRNIPKLYISGDQDHLFLPFVIDTFLHDRASSIHIIEKCGHVCNIERDKEFNRVSLYYLNRYPDLPVIKNVPVPSAVHQAPYEEWAFDQHKSK